MNPDYLPVPFHSTASGLAIQHFSPGFPVRLMLLVAHCHRQEYQGERREYDGLNQTYQQLQPENELHCHEWYQERYHDHQNLSGGHVAEKPECEADYPDKFADQL